MAKPHWRSWTRDPHAMLLGLIGLAILAGVVARLSGSRGDADVLWAAATVIGLIPLAYSVAVDLLHRETGVDVIALLAMAGALARDRADRAGPGR